MFSQFLCSKSTSWRYQKWKKREREGKTVLSNQRKKRERNGDGGKTGNNNMELPINSSSPAGQTGHPQSIVAHSQINSRTQYGKKEELYGSMAALKMPDTDTELSNHRNVNIRAILNNSSRHKEHSGIT